MGALGFVTTSPCFLLFFPPQWKKYQLSPAITVRERVLGKQEKGCSFLPIHYHRRSLSVL